MSQPIRTTQDTQQKMHQKWNPPTPSRSLSHLFPHEEQKEQAKVSPLSSHSIEVLDSFGQQKIPLHPSQFPESQQNMSPKAYKQRLVQLQKEELGMRDQKNHLEKRLELNQVEQEGIAHVLLTHSLKFPPFGKIEWNKYRKIAEGPSLCSDLKEILESPSPFKGQKMREAFSLFYIPDKFLDGPPVTLAHLNELSKTKLKERPFSIECKYSKDIERAFKKNPVGKKAHWVLISNEAFAEKPWWGEDFPDKYKKLTLFEAVFSALWNPNTDDKWTYCEEKANPKDKYYMAVGSDEDQCYIQSNASGNDIGYKIALDVTAK